MTLPATDAAPAAPMPRRPARPSGGLTFRDPGEEPWSSLPPAGTGEEPTTDLDDQPAASPSGSEWTPDESDEDDESARSSSRASSADSSARPFTQKAQKAAARTAVKVASGVAHQYLARDEAAQAVGLYLADDDDAEAIGDPLARIVARHSGDSGAMANPDVADGIAAMLGMAGFISKQIAKGPQMAAHRAERGQVQ
jgi:hypothetical protein